MMAITNLYVQCADPIALLQRQCAFGACGWLQHICHAARHDSEGLADIRVRCVGRQIWTRAGTGRVRRPVPCTHAVVLLSVQARSGWRHVYTTPNCFEGTSNMREHCVGTRMPMPVPRHGGGEGWGDRKTQALNHAVMAVFCHVSWTQKLAQITAVYVTTFIEICRSVRCRSARLHQQVARRPRDFRTNASAPDKPQPANPAIGVGSSKPKRTRLASGGSSGTAGDCSDSDPMSRRGTRYDAAADKCSLSSNGLDSSVQPSRRASRGCLPVASLRAASPSQHTPRSMPLRPANQRSALPALVARCTEPRQRRAASAHRGLTASVQPARRALRGSILVVRVKALTKANRLAHQSRQTASPSSPCSCTAHQTQAVCMLTATMDTQLTCSALDKNSRAHCKFTWRLHFMFAAGCASLLPSTLLPATHRTQVLGEPSPTSRSPEQQRARSMPPHRVPCTSCNVPLGTLAPLQATLPSAYRTPPRDNV
jgi:hypothetical protein